MSYKVRIDSFEGPFDLLLYLVSRQKVDIGAISITEIADQYLAEVSRMETLDLDVASDFLLVASTLLEIKAQSLIPRERDELDDDLAELAPLRGPRYAGRAPHGIQEVQERRRGAPQPLHRRGSHAHAPLRPLMPTSSASCLTSWKGCRWTRWPIRRPRPLRAVRCSCWKASTLPPSPFPVEVHVRAIHQRIRTAKHLRFSQLVGPGTPKDVAVVTFLAILELYKRVMVRLEQDELFGDIAIDYIENSGDLRLEGDDALTSVGEE